MEIIAATINGPTTNEIIEAGNSILIFDNELNRLSRIHTIDLATGRFEGDFQKITRCLDQANILK
jgi:hypothetical protein